MIKTKEARIFEDKVNQYLDKHDHDLKFFKNNLRDDQCLSLTLTIYVPKKDFFTKKGTVNLKCLDVSNSVKIIEDVIYSRIGVNDGLNCKISAEKRPWTGDDYLTLILIEKLSHPRACYLDEIPNMLARKMTSI